ncbi:MAG: DUF1214 domain-containing protein [Xenococcus sp. (in: cyanobacteria)]
MTDFKPTELSDAQVENLVRRSYQYVAMYNVNNKFAQQPGQDGYNTVLADTQLKDERFRDIARPNNDTLYISAMLDLRKEPLILDLPDFDSKYVSLMVTGYDHYVNIPVSTRQGNFKKPEKILFYSARTENYDGKTVDVVDHLFECSGDFVSAVFRVMPHANEPERFKKIAEQMKSVRLQTLSELQGKQPLPIDDVKFPPVGKTDADVFDNNLLEVMQFVFNHTTFDPDNAEDRAVLAALKPLGVEPVKNFDPNRIAKLDGKRIRQKAIEVQKTWLSRTTNQEWEKRVVSFLFQPKGKTTFEALLATSIIGPIGVPPEEALYPQVSTTDGHQMNAQHDYVIRMSKDELPPANAFWSLTLYDMKDGFFIPNDRKKYSVGENAGMQLNEDGGIEIYIAAEQPEGVPAENWLPIHRRNEALGIQFRVYVPDLEKMKTWTAPKAELIQ